MAILNQINHRYSVRSDQDRPVKPDKLQTVQETTRRAPSARNMQVLS